MLAYFNGNVSIYHANTGQAVVSKTIHCYKIVTKAESYRIKLCG